MTNALPFQSFIEIFSLRQHSFSAYFDHIFKTPGEENVLRTSPQKTTLQTGLFVL